MDNANANLKANICSNKFKCKDTQQKTFGPQVTWRAFDMLILPKRVPIKV